MDEAKWYDMQFKEKRRFYECFNDFNPPLSYGYATFTKDDFTKLKNHYKLFEDVSFPPIWDVAIRGYAYAHILAEMGAINHRSVFKFDRPSSKKEGDKIAEVIGNLVPSVAASHHSSRSLRGIQTADCLAGGIAEEMKGGEPWLNHIDDPESSVDCKGLALAHIEMQLDKV